MISSRRGYLDKGSRDTIEMQYLDRKRKQPGIAFPSASILDHIFIIRFNISDYLSGNKHNDRATIRGLNLCQLFDNISMGEKKLEKLSTDGDIKTMKLS